MKIPQKWQIPLKGGRYTSMFHLIGAPVFFNKFNMILNADFRKFVGAPLFLATILHRALAISLGTGLSKKKDAYTGKIVFFIIHCNPSLSYILL